MGLVLQREFASESVSMSLTAWPSLLPSLTAWPSLLPSLLECLLPLP